MSRLIRFLSKRRTGKGAPQAVQAAATPTKVKSKNLLQCTVVFLDGSNITWDLTVGYYDGVL